MSEGLLGFIGVAIFLMLVFVFCIVEDYYKTKARRKYEERLAKYDTNRKSTNSM